MNKDNYFVLTGAPGVGKTSLIKELRTNGFICIDEPAREILAEQRSFDGDAVPERDPRKFTDLLLSRSKSHYHSFLAHASPVIFDRSLVDAVAYASLFGIDVAPFEAVAQSYRYNQLVFVLAPWQGIYTNDDERKMSFDDSVQFHDMILDAYHKLNYTLLEVPPGTVKERAEYVIRKLATLSVNRARGNKGSSQPFS